MNDFLATVNRAAEQLGVKPVTLRKWMAERRIPFVRLGRCVRLREADIQQLIEKNVVPARCGR